MASQANESGLAGLVRTLAAMAVQIYPQSDTTSADRYAAMTSRNTSRLAENSTSGSGSIEVIAVKLRLAKATAGAVGERHIEHKAQLGNMLESIEQAPTEEVAMGTPWRSRRGLRRATRPRPCSASCRWSTT